MSSSPEMTEKDVVSWLQKNPEFFAQNPHALYNLETPMAAQGENIADFQYFMTERLREDRNVLEDQLGEIVGISRNNMQNQTRIHAAVIALLDAADFEAFIEVVTNELTLILDVDIARLMVESNGQDEPHTSEMGVSILPEAMIDNWLGFGKMSVLEGGIKADMRIFGESAPLIKSQALLRLVIAPDMPDALLVFGSSQADGFEKGQGTELISFLARVIERQMRRWLI